jgi:hypothetical protein
MPPPRRHTPMQVFSPSADAGVAIITMPSPRRHTPMQVFSPASTNLEEQRPILPYNVLAF